jgi:hydrogenase maturation protease
MAVKPVLVFGYGNVSRGDDALAPLLIERLQNEQVTSACGHPIKYLTDYQIQIEHILDMQGCERVLLIDAHQSLQRPFQFYQVSAKLETSYTTHGMTPSTLLHTYETTLRMSAPLTCVLAIQGEAFNLGEPLSTVAGSNLLSAYKYCMEIFKHSDFAKWDENSTSRYDTQLVY